MEGDQEQNHPNNVDLTLRLEVGDSRTAPENPEIEENFEPGFAMMAGEHNNPWPNIAQSNSFGLAAEDTNQNEMPMQEFLQMLMSVNYYGNLDELLNGEVEEEGQGNETEDIDLTENNDGDLTENNDGDLSENNDGDLSENNDGDLFENNDGDLFENNDDDLEYYADGELVSDDGLQELRLDIDDMSHEALLEIEEQIGNARVGLDQDTVDDRLMQDTYQPNETPQLSLCIICMEDFKEGDLFGVLECGHNYFHPGCITTWLMEKNECPLCKSVALPTA